VHYENKKVATNALQLFFQPHKNVTWVHVKLTAQTVVLPDFLSEIYSGEITTRVGVRARRRFKVAVLKISYFILRIHCYHVRVSLS